MHSLSFPFLFVVLFAPLCVLLDRHIYIHDVYPFGSGTRCRSSPSGKIRRGTEWVVLLSRGSCALMTNDSLIIRRWVLLSRHKIRKFFQSILWPVLCMCSAMDEGLSSSFCCCSSFFASFFFVSSFFVSFFFFFFFFLTPAWALAGSMFLLITCVANAAIRSRTLLDDRSGRTFCCCCCCVFTSVVVFVEAGAGCWLSIGLSVSSLLFSFSFSLVRTDHLVHHAHLDV